MTDVAKPGREPRDTALRPFRPFPLLGHPHLQTVLAGKLGLPRTPPASTHVVLLEDGDAIALRVSTPPPGGRRPTPRSSLSMVCAAAVDLPTSSVCRAAFTGAVRAQSA